MVQQYQSPVRVYKYPFELVMVAYERRFPRCPQIPVVLDCVVIDDSWSSDWSQRHTSRRCQLSVEAPYILKKMIGVECVYFLQKNHLDRRAKSLYIEATNESFVNRVVVVEKCRYFVHPENSQWTCFEQSASLDVKNFFGFESAIEKIAMKQYSANISKGKEIIDYFIIEIAKEGITDVQAWKEDDEKTNRTTRNLLCNGEQSPTEVFSIEAETEELKITETRRKSSVKGKKSKDEHTDNYKLDTDYIQRYLGELTVMQESRLVQLRKWVADLQKGKVPNDATLLRFLRARDFNVEKAREMLSQSLIWRKKHQVDKILSEYQVPQVATDYFPGGWHHNDKDGRPLYVLRLGQMDVKGLLKSIGEEGLLKLTLHICEEGLSYMAEATKATGRPIWTWCLLVDLDGLNMRHLWRPGIRALLRIIQIVEANYPETMGRVLIIRAPRVFPILWTIVSTFIDDNTRSKFLFYGGKDYLQSSGGLVDYIPHEFVPDFLGGPCKSLIHDGGLVPKNLYASGAFTDRGELCPFSEDSIYRSVSLSKGNVHEVVVRNEDPSSVLTWDFDVLRQDIAFTVFKINVPVPNVDIIDKVITTTPSGAPHPDGEPHRTVIDKSWQEGVQYNKVECTIICHDGESIQGSHVMTETGAYILQWRWHHHNPHHDLIDSLTHPKAQLMYFYETLASEDYRGSMSSLQSGNSGFSVLSGRSQASSCPSRFS
ncbi:real-time isoform X2 [Arctopsyche grandis]|uniref:real-time isoform X2 n=1 Tax=Arctopsyche grandis TaxID=121162 RepID=UPI00406D7027